MAVDNDLYNRTGDIWWDENEHLSMLRTMVNPARFGFFREVLSKHAFGKRCKLLDVGCGGGLLAEEFTGIGQIVTGIDPSYNSVATARTHAAKEGLIIEYAAASGERIPFASETYDAVVCCDVLEHLQKPDDVIREIARVLKSGGLFLYDTINRTWRSKLAIIKAFQEWEWISCAPPNLHSWTNFIQPAELRAMMASANLENRLTVGMKPSAGVIECLSNMRKRKRGEITYGELGRRMQMAQSKDLSLSYMGYAVKIG
jgi:2-polyprenyl-6-hydroxyphenyl methylase/3-demethylubiquinone-9 3-methyltransferase